MDEDNGNDGISSTLLASGNPHISTELCKAYRGHIETKIDTMETKILSVVKLTGLAVGLVVTIVQLGLHFFGG